MRRRFDKFMDSRYKRSQAFLTATLLKLTDLQHALRQLVAGFITHSLVPYDDVHSLILEIQYQLEDRPGCMLAVYSPADFYKLIVLSHFPVRSILFVITRLPIVTEHSDAMLYRRFTFYNPAANSDPY